MSSEREHEANFEGQEAFEVEHDLNYLFERFIVPINDQKITVSNNQNQPGML